MNLQARDSKGRFISKPGIGESTFKLNIPHGFNPRYPVITYSINKRYLVFKEYNWLVEAWRCLWNKRPEQIGYHYEAEIVVCKDALDYLQPNDIIQIRQKQWFVQARGQGFLIVRTTEPTQQIVPISIGDLVIKLYSIHPKP